MTTDTARVWVHRTVVAFAVLVSVVVAGLWSAPEAGAQSNSADVLHTSSCLAGNGRVDTMIVNRTAAAAVFRLEFEGLSPRQRTVQPGDWWRMPITGRPDRGHQVVVKRDNQVLSDQTVVVSCDAEPPVVTGPEVVPIVSCRAGLGYVLFQFLNASDSTAGYVIEFEGVRNRSVSAGPYGQGLRAVTGRPDGTYAVEIRAGARVVYGGSVTVGCEEDPGVAVPTRLREENQGIDRSGYSYVGLAWSGIPAPASVQIERDGEIIRDDENRAYRDILIPARSPGEMVTYRVRGIAEDGNPSAWSDPLVVTIIQPPQADIPLPVNLRETNQGIDGSGLPFVGLAWAKPAGIPLIEIERDGVPIRTDADVAYRDVPTPALAVGQTVSYRIRSITSAGQPSLWSDVLIVTVR